MLSYSTSLMSHIVINCNISVVTSIEKYVFHTSFQYCERERRTLRSNTHCRSKKGEDSIIVLFTINTMIRCHG